MLFPRIGKPLALLILAIGLTSRFPAAAQDATYPRAVTIAGCPNVFEVSDRLLSGGAPDGDTGFKALADAGVKTIISVDGAKPDVDRAARFGLRYVHIPIGYDGVPREKSLEIARAIRDLPAKVYIHCHHGKHRSPAATASVMVCSQGWSTDRAVAYMKTAGTAPTYLGLYSDVQNATPAHSTDLDRTDNAFPPVAKVPGFVDFMVVLDERFDALTKSREAGWAPPPGHPDIVPAHEALQLYELIHENARTSQSPHKESDFVAWMHHAESAAEELEKSVRTGPPGKADAAFAALKQSCTDCHAKYRNVPQAKTK